MKPFAVASLVILGLLCFAYERWVETLRTHRRMGRAFLHAPTAYLNASWVYHLISYALLVGWFFAFKICGFSNWSALVPVITWFAAGGAAQRRAFDQYRHSLKKMLEDPDTTVDKEFLRQELALSNAELVLRIRQHERIGLR